MLRLCMLFVVSGLALAALPHAADAAHRRHFHRPHVVSVDDWGRCWIRRQGVWWQTVCPAVRVASRERIIVR
jgi:hypothetical protein